MTRTFSTVMAIGSLVFTMAGNSSAMLQAQTTQSTQTTVQVSGESTDQWHGRAFLFESRDGGVNQSGIWSSGNGLRKYADAHPHETFVVFVQDGKIHRLDTPAEMQKLGEVHESLEQLSALQTQLSRSMTPLTEEQQALVARIQATSNPQDMSHVGQAMGSVGRQQGIIGKQQGVIGREQGRLGRAFYQTAQQAIDQCLSDKTCPVVGS